MNYRQDNWATLLPLVEIAYNSHKHTTTGKSPYYLHWTWKRNQNPSGVAEPRRIILAST